MVRCHVEMEARRTKIKDAQQPCRGDTETYKNIFAKSSNNQTFMLETTRKTTVITFKAPVLTGSQL